MLDSGDHAEGALQGARGARDIAHVDLEPIDLAPAVRAGELLGSRAIVVGDHNVDVGKRRLDEVAHDDAPHGARPADDDDPPHYRGISSRRFW